MTTKIIITKEQALAAYGWKQAELARALKITSGAITQWLPGQAIPEAQALKLYYQLKPGAFASSEVLNK